MPDPQTDAQLAEDDAGVLAAAVALRYDQRPVLIGFEHYDGMWWWANTPAEERRKYLRAARVAVEAWENFWKERGL
jgi:hypothetical protein